MVSPKEKSLDSEGSSLYLEYFRSAPPGVSTFDIQGSPGVNVNVADNNLSKGFFKGAGKWPVSRGVEVSLTTTKVSREPNDIKVKVTYYGQKETSDLNNAMLYLTSVDVALEVDTHRTGAVNGDKADKASWTWGPRGHGAVLLVNCDRDKTNSRKMDSLDTSPPNATDLKDMSTMVLKTCGPHSIFEGYSLCLNISKEDVDKVEVNLEQDFQYKAILGRNITTYEMSYNGKEKTTFYLEGLFFPDVDFPGLVSIQLTLKEKDNKVLKDALIFTDEVVFRIAPWIMTPNTLEPLEVFVCSVPDNGAFLEKVKSLAKKANCKLTICSELDNRRDRWIQDEMELGYVEAPQKNFPVVFDSPRNGPLQYYPIKKILGPDFGYVTREPVDPNDVSTLDSFGNLEVSPPLTVNGKEYPLGRILIGGHSPTYDGLRMTKVVRDFLHAQKVQPPLELWSDWLQVGHVDEFLTFVPAPSPKGFRLLLASTTACYKLFQEKKKAGHGDAIMFKGLKVETCTIDQILSDETLKKENEFVQSCIDTNRDLLKKELGLSEKDIIDIPALFKLDSDALACAFFPDMVNMLVLGKHLGIPMPFGPIIDGKCCLEEKVSSLLEPLGLSCNYINDFYTYHLLSGEVHCGTNVRRKPFSFKWWNVPL
ncbi:protein-arginine deiminase type-3-like [Ambystoma mexicanum]|uniref:protein-arginine deiminase type-3-like n=1 Tax=Ambystoma mexicanum TaxID=8296 RepID=UPI0037E74A4E